MLTLRHLLSDSAKMYSPVAFIAYIRSQFKYINTHQFTSRLLLFMLFFIAPLTQAQKSVDAIFNASELLWIKQNKQVSLAYDANYPPYSFLNEEQKFEGFSVDVFKLLAKSTGLEFKLYPKSTWDDIYSDAKANKVDIVATMVSNSERLQWFNFTVPYIFKSQVIITRDEDTSIGTKSDIMNKSVALVKGYQSSQKVLLQYPSVTPIYFDSIRGALHALSTGKVDAAISFFGTSHFLRKKYLLSNLKYAAIFDKNNANEGISIRKDSPVLASIISKALIAIPEAQLQKLREKWLLANDLEEFTEIELTQKELAWIKDHPNIRLGIDPEYAPFEFIEDNQYKGMVADYIKLLNQRLKLNMQVTPNLSWSEVIKGAQAQSIDVLPAVTSTAQRKEYLAFSAPYLNFQRVIVTQSNVPLISGLSHLTGKIVAVQKDTSNHDYLLQNSHIEPVLYDTLQQSILAVSSGEADAYIGNVAAATYWIRKLNLTNLKIAAPVSNQVQRLRFGVRQDWPELIAIIQKGLDSISARQHQSISEKWLSIEYVPGIDPSVFWKTATGVFLLIVMVVFWNIRLNRKVKLRTSQLAYSSNYDKLTNLPNRFLILDRLNQKISETRNTLYQIAVVSIDINDFKSINNIYGHHVGDQLLVEYSQRLQESLKKNQSVGRISSNQFLMIQSNILDSADPSTLAEHAIACMTKPFAAPINDIEMKASIGITLYPADGNNAELLLKNADAATQHAKKQANGNYTYYTDRLTQDVSRKLLIEKELQYSIERNELEVYFQPKLSPKNKRIVSFEALLRWNNGELGTVSPVEFIPIAEKSDIINQIGFFVIERSLTALEKWQNKYLVEFSVAVNLSPVQFQSDGLLPKIASILKQHSVANSALEFEITEGVLLTECINIDEKLRGLEDLGVSLAMDDFGTGYSSLSYLRKYRFNTLKIDREFITELPHSAADKKLVSAIIAMAHELGMKVVAEGVENEAQNAFLIEQNCDYVQGWLFSKAQNFSAITQLLDQHYPIQTPVANFEEQTFREVANKPQDIPCG